MTGALPDLSIFMLTLLAPERRRGWNEALGVKAVAVATMAATAITLVDIVIQNFVPQAYLLGIGVSSLWYFFDLLYAFVGNVTRLVLPLHENNLFRLEIWGCS
jgi:hypothetical protein